MSAENLRGVRTLVRLRAFQESLAERDRMQAAAAAQAARDAAERTHQAACAIGERRAALIGVGALDLGMVEAVADCEERAWDRADADASARDQADAAHGKARDRHLQARAGSRVADTRCDALTAIEQDREDKRGYDRMASLLVAAAVSADAAGAKDASDTMTPASDSSFPHSWQQESHPREPSPHEPTPHDTSSQDWTHDA